MCNPDDSNYTVYLGTHCGGTTMATLQDGTAYAWNGTIPECSARCSADDSCGGFVWRASDTKCFWKKGVYLNTLKPRYTKGVSCYMKNTDADSEFTAYGHTHCGGNTIDDLQDGTSYGQSGTVAECEAKCSADADCDAFMWRMTDQKCFWKAGVSDMTRRDAANMTCYTKKTVDMESRTREFELTLVANNRKGQRYGGKRFGESLTECVQACAYSPNHRCQGVSHNAQRQHCYFTKSLIEMSEKPGWDLYQVNVTSFISSSSD